MWEPESRPPRPTALPLVFEGVSLEAQGRWLLRDVSLHLAAGPLSVILGPNGAGKTLTLRLCEGLLRPTAGRVRWLGPGAARAPEVRGMVFQRPVMLRRSVRANVAYPLRLRRLPRAQRKARVARVLEATGLEDLARRPARLLSVGEQQRLALARVWALEPEVVFLDEPAAALDPAACRGLEHAVRHVADEGTKVVMTTHDLAQARRMADEVLFLHRGRLLEQSPAGRFFDEPRSAEAKAFLRGELLP